MYHTNVDAGYNYVDMEESIDGELILELFGDPDTPHLCHFIFYLVARRSGVTIHDPTKSMQLNHWNLWVQNEHLVHGMTQLEQYHMYHHDISMASGK